MMSLQDRRLPGGDLRDLCLECLGVTHERGRVVAADGVELLPVPAEQIHVIALPAREGDELIVGHRGRIAGAGRVRGTPRAAGRDGARRGVATAGRQQKDQHDHGRSHGPGW